MALNTQLKRGYLALIGLVLMAFGLSAAPDPFVGAHELIIKEFAQTNCKTGQRSHWHLAATPFDIPSLHPRKSRLCRA